MEAVETHSFDAMGNRLQKQDSAPGNENYSWIPSIRICQGFNVVPV
jgi:hypothetical protein